MQIMTTTELFAAEKAISSQTIKCIVSHFVSFTWIFNFVDGLQKSAQRNIHTEQ
jgi:uncharacterized membrane protein